MNEPRMERNGEVVRRVLQSIVSTRVEAKPTCIAGARWRCKLSRTSGHVGYGAPNGCLEDSRDGRSCSAGSDAARRGGIAHRRADRYAPPRSDANITEMGKYTGTKGLRRALRLQPKRNSRRRVTGCRGESTHETPLRTGLYYDGM